MRKPQARATRRRNDPLDFLPHGEPNGEITAMSFKQAMMVNLLLGGNAYAFVEYDMSGRVMALYPLLHTDVAPYRNTDGHVRFTVLGDTYSRYEAYSLGIIAEILTPNEARSKENTNPVEGDDEMRLPLNVTTRAHGASRSLARGPTLSCRL